MDYPIELIRGIPNNTYLENGYPNTRLFNECDVNPGREDDYYETSINWKDEDQALMLIFDRKRDNGEYQFKVGGAILSTFELDRLCKKPQIKGLLSYERRIVEGNIYHGNILFKKETPKSMRNMIASAIAFCVVDVKLREG
jgi:hypothetical protein